MSWWPSVVSMEVRKILAYRSEFWVTFLGQTFIQLFIARALWQNIFASQGTTEMQGFTLPMMTLYYLIVPLGSRILQGESVGFLSREIYDGTFTRYLIYPLSFFQYKTLTYLTYSAFYASQLFILFFLYKIFFVTEALTILDVSNFVLGVGMFFISSITFLTMMIIVELLALWVDNVWSLNVMLRFFNAFLGGATIPLTFFPDWGQRLVHYTPFPYLMSLPARTILGKTTWEEVLQGMGISLLWALFFSVLIKFMWQRGQKRYSGVGI